MITLVDTDVLGNRTQPHSPQQSHISRNGAATGAALDRVLAALRGHQCNPRKSVSGYSAKCPAHEDRNPSLSVGVGNNGQVLLFCHVCGHAAIRGADDKWVSTGIVEAMGLTLPDLFSDGGNSHRPAQSCHVSTLPKAARPSKAPRPALGPFAATYSYPDLHGTELYQVVRPMSGSPRFQFRHMNGDGRYYYGAGDGHKVLYDLPTIAKAPADSVVWIVEGEKDADRLHDVGFFATCNPSGACHWNLIDDSPLHGRHVVILPDNDETGRRHAEQVAVSLQRQAASIKIVGLEGLPEHGDVSDWLDAGGDPADLDELGTRTPEWTPPADLAPPTPAAAPTTPAEARMEREGIFTAFKDENVAKMATCVRLAMFYAPNGGAYALGEGGEPVPLVYFASVWGCSVSRVSQRIAAGRFWLYHLGKWALSTEEMGGVYHGKLVCTHSDPLAQRLTERHLRPLLGLRSDQQAPALARGFAIARERHVIETAERQKMDIGPKTLRAKACHMKQSAAELQPPPAAGGCHSSRKLWERLRRDLAAAEKIDGYPKRIVDGLRTVVVQAERQL